MLHKNHDHSAICVKAMEPLRGSSLRFMTKLPVALWESAQTATLFQGH